MARKVETYRDFLKLLERLKDKRRLFAFLLIDNRPSSLQVAKYFDANFHWLYNLADASEMIVFVPQYIPEVENDVELFYKLLVEKFGVKSHHDIDLTVGNRYDIDMYAYQRPYDQILKALQIEYPFARESFERERNVAKAKNPSLWVANRFEIQANQLPGVVFFTVPEFKAGNGIFFPLDEKMFVENPEHIEKVISLLFGIVQKCQKESKTEHLLTEQMGLEIEKLITDENNAPLRKYLAKNWKAIQNIPISFFDSLGPILSALLVGQVVKVKTP